MRIFGIAATEDVDRHGETVSLEGMDIDSIENFNDEHQSKSFFHFIGRVTEAKKIFSSKDCQDEYQARCWNAVKRPFLYVAGDLAEDHPNAESAYSLIKYSQRNPDFPVGFSVEGSILLRDGSRLEKTKVKNVSLTIKPANPTCIAFPAVDLMKSDETIELPDLYKSFDETYTKAFKNIPSIDAQLLAKSTFLKEAMAALEAPEAELQTMAMVGCVHCGQAKLFSKKRLPNVCMSCGEKFSMKDLFKAMTKTSQI